MSDYAGKRSGTGNAYEPEVRADAAPGKRTRVEQLGVGPNAPAQSPARNGIVPATVEAFPVGARPTIQTLFGSHLPKASGGVGAIGAAPSDVAPADATGDRDENAMDALAHDIVQHEPLHDKLAFVPDDVLEQLVRQVGRRALIGLATGGAEVPAAAPAIANGPTEEAAGQQTASPAPANTGLFARIRSRRVADHEGGEEPEDREGADDHEGLKDHEASDAHEAPQGQEGDGDHGEHEAKEPASPLAPVQRRAADGAARGDHAAAVHASAQRGIATPATRLPHHDAIQRAFGHHDISSIQAHVGADAAASALEMGADAYATGAHVVAGVNPDLSTMAHEAAHVVQQRAGIHGKAGVGEANDRYEQHADEVASLVVQGKSAQDLLDRYAGTPPGGSARSAAAAAPQSATPTAAPIVQRHHRGHRILNSIKNRQRLGPGSRRKFLIRKARLPQTKLRWLRKQMLRKQIKYQEQQKNFDTITRGNLNKDAAPKKIRLSKQLKDGMQRAWDGSFPGGTSKEQGGNLLRETNGGYEWREGNSGSSGSFMPDYNDVDPGQTLVGVGHTHPYDQSEGGHTDVSFSGDDISSIVYEERTQPLNIVKSGETVFILARTQEFEQRLQGLDAKGLKELKLKIENTWNDVYRTTQGSVPTRAEAATRATCQAFHLVYYRGKGSSLIKIDVSK